MTVLGPLFVGRSREWRRRVFDDRCLPVMKAAGQNNATDRGGADGKNDTHALVPHPKAARGVPRPLLSKPHCKPIPG